MSDTPPVISDAAALRRQYLNHEASIRSIGSLYYLGAVIGLMVGALTLLGPRQAVPMRYLIGPLMILLGVAYWKLGAWLRNLDARGRIPATVLACIGLIAFPIGTLINAYILYLLNSKKAAVVFSDEYHRVIEATPEIKYRTSIVVVLFAVLLAIVLLGAVAALMLGKH
jgi:hypothetical protein